ncbi:MAG: endolytic transglycosylase MltG [Lachnospiraceae bacterium]|jgi:hypothetical protein|nr:endolytic transglycosylase MltG [Lachnospiraceae bacterium]
MNMHLRSFTLGLGVGIMIISAIFYAGTLIFKPAPETKTLTQEVALTDAQIEERARKMGMIFIKELPVKGDEIKNTLSDEEIIERALALGLQEKDSKEGIKESSQEEPKETVKLTIYSGDSTQQISNLLYEKGIVDDAEAFTKFVLESQKTTRLRAGEFELYKNMKYEDVLYALTKKR